MTKEALRRPAAPLAAVAMLLLIQACSGQGPIAPAVGTVLESVTPAAGSTAVDPSAPITIRFSGPMAAGMEQYLDMHQGDVSGPIVPMNCTFSTDRTTVTCVHGQPLQSGATYTIHMGLGMMDGQGQPVEVEPEGLAMGGTLVRGQMMGGMHGGQPMGMMGQRWQDAEGDLGMAFTFQPS